MIRTAILYLEASGETGTSPSRTVQAVRQVLAEGPYVEVDYHLLPVEQAIIRSKLRLWADGDYVDLVLTLGGTGLGLRDRTPEATREVIEREVPGLAELMRLSWLRRSRLAALDRGLAGIRKETLILNLPGSEEGAVTALRSVLGVLPTAVAEIVGKPLRELLGRWSGAVRSDADVNPAGDPN